MRFAAVGLFCAALVAQVDTGAVSGVVTDRSGAVVPGASVAILQIETNIRTDLETNESGFYSAPSLRVGRYEISVSHEGFRPQKSQPFDLRVQDRAEINFQLEVGATNSEVTVTAAASLLETETSSLGQVVEGKAITELPLNGRNFIQLAILGAGALPSTRTAERDSFISNGARGVQNSYLLDGFDNRNRIMGFDKSSAQIVQPIIDGIQEFKVQTATFSAEFGQAAGGVVNVTMKSGTNTFHGNVFEFLRNSYMDATPYFQPAGGGKPQFIQNQFGATFGGPVIKSRTFFFGSWQSTREQNGAPQISTVPTLAMRQGVFAGRVNDPTTKQPLPGNTIPQNLWDPVATKLLSLYPLPNLTGSRNFFYNPTERLSGDMYNIRADHRIGRHDAMFARVSQTWNDNHLPEPLPDPANQQGAVNLVARSIMVNETHTFSSGTKMNEVRLGQIYSLENQDLIGPRLFDEYGIKGALDTPKIKGLPNFTITGLSNLGTVPPGTTPIPATGSGNFPVVKSGKIWQLLDNFSWVHGRHTIKTGIDFQRVTMYVYATNSARPTFTFNGTYSGAGLGDFLVGYVNNANTSQQQNDTIQQSVRSGYVQDDWKVSGKVTLNLGIRYELQTPFVEEYDRQSNFIRESGACQLQIVIAADRARCGLSRAMTSTDYNNFAPRLGLAYQATGKTVIRSGFGVFHGRDENLGITRRLPNNPPFVTSATFTGDQTNPAFVLKDGFPDNALSLASGAGDLNSFPLQFPIPYVIQWNLNIQREAGGNFVAQVGYTGSEAHKLPAVVNVNQALPGTGNVNARRPYQGFSNIQVYGPYVNSTYHALLAKLERRFSAGIHLLASYTYGHSIDGGGNNNDQSDPGPQDARNLRAHKGASNFDVRQRFVVSGLYQLPFGKAKGALAPLVRNWQLSGIYSVQTGQPFTVTTTPDPTATNATARPNRLRDGNLPSDQRNLSRWFDTAAFAATGCVCFGNSGRNIIRAPGFSNMDLGIARDFRFRERFRVQIRGEAFNLFNHPNLGLPNMQIGNPLVGTISTVINPERQIQAAMKLYF